MSRICPYCHARGFATTSAVSEHIEDAHAEDAPKIKEKMNSQESLFFTCYVDTATNERWVVDDSNGSWAFWSDMATWQHWSEIRFNGRPYLLLNVMFDVMIVYETCAVYYLDEPWRN